MKLCTKWITQGCQNCKQIKTCPVVANFTLCTNLQKLNK
jgi:hypothetical protein